MAKKLYELPREELDRIFSAAPFVADLGIRLVSLGLIAESAGFCEAGEADKLVSKTIATISVVDKRGRS